MKSGFIQFKPVFGDIQGNLDRLKNLISSTDADLLVIPELATSGYAFTSKEELADLSEPFENSSSLDTLQELAREKSCALVTGFAEKSGGRLYNSAALLRPDGSRELYRKLHLFGAENMFFEPGDIPFAAHDYNGVKLGIMICFDWFFPESARTLALKGAQIICHPVNFVLPWGQRGAVFASLWNHVYMITANRYGSEKRGDFSFTFTGNSQMTDPVGDIIASAPETEDAVVVLDIDPMRSLDKNLNKYNNLWKCRRPEYYGEITE